MNKRWEISKKIIAYARNTILIFCTIIGGYGILSAPESDQNILERELQHNQEILQQMNISAYAEAKVNDSTATPANIKSKNNKSKKQNGIISVIGDSVFLGAAPSFQKLQKNAIIDAKISRQVYHALDVAKQLKKKGRLGDTVIISLGINGTFSQSTGQKLIDYLGKDRTIYWISAYGKNVKWQGDVNRTIQKLTKNNNNLHIIPWAKEAKKHPNWFYQDGTHLNQKGQIGFAKFVKKNMKELS